MFGARAAILNPSFSCFPKVLFLSPIGVLLYRIQSHEEGSGESRMAGRNSGQFTFTFNTGAAGRDPRLRSRPDPLFVPSNTPPCLACFIVR